MRKGLSLIMVVQWAYLKVLVYDLSVLSVLLIQTSEESLTMIKV